MWQHREECTLPVSIGHHHAGPLAGVMVWGAIGYMSRSPLVHIDGTLNIDHYISAGTVFQQDNLILEFASIVHTFLDAENVWLLPLLACFPDLSPIENLWSVVDERLPCHHIPITFF